MDIGNQSQEWRGTKQTAINCDTFWLQTLGTHVIVLWQIQKFMLLYSFCFVLCCIWGHFQGISLGGAYIRRGDLTEVFCVTSFKGLYLEGLIHGRAYFRNFTVYNIRSLRKLATDNLYVLKVICRLEGSPTHPPPPPPNKSSFSKKKKYFQTVKFILKFWTLSIIIIIIIIIHFYIIPFPKSPKALFTELNTKIVKWTKIS